MATESSNEMRLKKLQALSDEVEPYENELANMEDVKARKPKWSWSHEANCLVQTLQSLATDSKNYELTHSPLDRILEWPDKKSSDPKLFYGGKEGFEIFNRTEDWFSEMGFAKYETQYSFSDRWDKKQMSATFLVPDSIKAGASVPIMWFFHGGGFCTGASDHIPWYSKASLERAKQHGAVVIAPDYPLGPEANYTDIVEAIHEFLRFYKEDGWFGDDEKGWTSWLLRKMNKADTRLDTGRVFVEGESAGGHAVVTALFLNAKEPDLMLDIKVALLRYPMLKHYTRLFPANGSSLEYMGQKVTKDTANVQFENIKKEIDTLEELGLVPTTVKRYSPQGMAAAFILSTTQKWQSLFQRTHGPGGKQDVDPADFYNMDCLERAQKLAGSVDQSHLPPILIYHGHDDSNCPFEDAENFKQHLMKMFPRTYFEDQTVFLRNVTEICRKPVWNKAKNTIEFEITQAVGHGFDYSLSEAKEPFLKEAYTKVESFWMAA